MPTYTLVSGVVVTDSNGRVALVEERRPRLEGQWNLPSGRIEEGEHPKEAAARELAEETGLTVSLGAPVGIYVKPSGKEGMVCIFIYAGAVDRSPKLTPQDDDIGNAEWVEPNRVTERRLRSSHIEQAIDEAVAGVRVDEERIHRFDSA